VAGPRAGEEIDKGGGRAGDARLIRDSVWDEWTTARSARETVKGEKCREEGNAGGAKMREWGNLRDGGGVRGD